MPQPMGSKDYYKKVKQEITATNEAIKKGVMKGANVKRIPDFQSVKQLRMFYLGMLDNRVMI